MKAKRNLSLGGQDNVVCVLWRAGLDLEYGGRPLILIARATVTGLGLDKLAVMKGFNASGDLNRPAMQIVLLPSDTDRQNSSDALARTALCGFGVGEHHNPPVGALANKLFEQEGAVARRSAPNIVPHLYQDSRPPITRDRLLHGLGCFRQFDRQLLPDAPEHARQPFSFGLGQFLVAIRQDDRCRSDLFHIRVLIA